MPRRDALTRDEAVIYGQCRVGNIARTVQDMKLHALFPQLNAVVRAIYNNVQGVQVRTNDAHWKHIRNRFKLLRAKFP